MMGWIKLYRKSFESDVWGDANLWLVWCWCLLRANHRPCKVRFAGEDIELKSGQFISGRFAGAEECKMPPSTFRNQMVRLRELGNLDTISDNKKTIFTVVNWTLYQGRYDKEDSKTDNERTQTRRKEEKKDSLTETQRYFLNDKR